MPYIEQNIRDILDIGEIHPVVPGDLNYVITKAVVRFLGKSPNYAMFNAAVGALECAKLELYRRMVAPYEDEKIDLNGDVY